MAKGEVTLCDIDNTIYVDNIYIGMYRYDHDGTISFQVFMSGRGGYEGNEDTEENAIKAIADWMERHAPSPNNINN